MGRVRNRSIFTIYKNNQKNGRLKGNFSLRAFTVKLNMELYEL